LRLREVHVCARVQVFVNLCKVVVPEHSSSRTGLSSPSSCENRICCEGEASVSALASNCLRARVNMCVVRECANACMHECLPTASCDMAFVSFLARKISASVLGVLKLLKGEK
jgi:nucleoside phosphorylase